MTGIVHVLGKEKIKSVACHEHECPPTPIQTHQCRGEGRMIKPQQRGNKILGYPLYVFLLLFLSFKFCGVIT